MEGFIKQIEKHGIRYTRDFSLSRVSAMRLGGVCDAFVTPQNEEELKKTVAICAADKIKYKIVGRMTNILPPDDKFEGVVISTSKINGYNLAENVLNAKCGAMLSRIALELARRGYGGLAELSGIPGTVGGMVYSNAGAYGKEISDVLLDARLYDIQGEREVIFPLEEMRLSYRNSILKSGNYLLLEVRFKVYPLFSEQATAQIREVAKKRRKSQPLDMPSLGSTFLRPEGYYAAKLIDDAGLRGASVGDAEVSKKHAGFIVNRGTASSGNVKALISLIQNTVFEKFGVRLIPEIEFME